MGLRIPRSLSREQKNSTLIIDVRNHARYEDEEGTLPHLHECSRDREYGDQAVANQEVEDRVVDGESSTFSKVGAEAALLRARLPLH